MPIKSTGRFSNSLFNSTARGMRTEGRLQIPHIVKRLQVIDSIDDPGGPAVSKAFGHPAELRFQFLFSQWIGNFAFMSR